MRSQVSLFITRSACKLCFGVFVFVGGIYLSSVSMADSQVVTTTLDSPSLAGNPLGDPATRSARVYLPPSYETSEKRYPTLYLLHGTGGSEFSFPIQGMADNLIRERKMEEMIIVSVDGRSGYEVSFYENSVLNGNHRDYIVNDLVTHIDENFRTVPERDSRGVAGHSTGGYGAFLFGMKHPDVFGAIYSYSGGGLCFSRPECVAYLGGQTAQFSDEVVAMFGDPATILGRVQSPDQIRGPFPEEMYSMAAAFSPNLDNGPFFVDMPWKLPDLTIVPDVRDRWYDHDMFRLLETHADDLKRLNGIAFDVGEQDEIGLQRENISFHEALVEADVPHDFETFQGGHGNRLPERVGISFEYFSDVLVSPNKLPLCDFDIDGSCGVSDLSRRTMFRVNLVDGSDRSRDVDQFDLNADGVVDTGDLGFWLADAAKAAGLEDPFLPGDSNLDGTVDFVDFLSLSANFDTNNRDWFHGNFNGDRAVDFVDFLALSANFGSNPPATVRAVPEPDSTVTPALIGLAVAFLQRRRTVRLACWIQRHRCRLSVV